jgi:hypothetical protein
MISAEIVGVDGAPARPSMAGWKYIGCVGTIDDSLEPQNDDPQQRPDDGC